MQLWRVGVASAAAVAAPGSPSDQAARQRRPQRGDLGVDLGAAAFDRGGRDTVGVAALTRLRISRDELMFYRLRWDRADIAAFVRWFAAEHLAGSDHADRAALGYLFGWFSHDEVGEDGRR